MSGAHKTYRPSLERDDIVDHWATRRRNEIMAATIIQFRRAQAASADRIIDAGNRFLAERLGLIPVRPGVRYVPILGRTEEREPFEMQLED